MASIDCPGCGATLSSYLVDVVAGGGELAGAGGLTCPQCKRNIRHSEIRGLLLKASQKARPPSGSGAGCGVVAAALGCALLALLTLT